MQLESLLDKIYNKPSVPLFIEGKPGGGKTEQIRAFAKAMEKKLGHPFPLVTLQLSAMDETDLAGMPSLDETTGATVWSRPAWVDELQGGGILFLDEINCGRKSVMDTALTLVQNRFLPGNKATLPETVMILAAYNPADLCSNTDFNPALLNRGMVVSWNPSIAEWAAWFLGSRKTELSDLPIKNQFTIGEWKKAFGGNTDYDLDKRILLAEALKEGLVETPEEEYEPNQTVTSFRSLENLLYWADSAEQAVQWAPAFLDKKGAEVLAKVKASIYKNVTNSIFGNGGNTADNAEETARLSEKQSVIDRIKQVAE